MGARCRTWGRSQALLGARREQGQCYLCRQEEDLIWDVPDPAGDDAQSHSRKHIGVVSLSRNEGPAILQGDTLKRTSAGKDPSALEAGRKPETELGDRFWAVRWPNLIPNIGPFFMLSQRLSIVFCSFDQKA